MVLVACGDDDGPGDVVDMASAGCVDDGECDDGLFCNGGETCVAGVCTRSSAPCGDCEEETDSCGAGCVDADGDGASAVECGGNDCDDSDPERFPGNPEICDAEGVDEDCDPVTYGFRDQDMDGVGDAACCNGDNCGLDCDDMRASVGGVPLETCDGLDNDCDGSIDEGVLLTYYPDVDIDGYGDDEGTPVMGCMPPPGYVSGNTDCDDANDQIHPGAFDDCDPGNVDQDCDGTPNNPVGGCSCANGTYDCALQAGACSGSQFVCSGGVRGACNYEPEEEVCNEIDDDCDGIVDEGLPTTVYYRDADGDGYGAPATGVEGCREPRSGDWVTRRGDCDDTDEDAHVGQTAYFDTPRNGGGFDYDCNDTEEMQFDEAVCGCNTGVLRCAFVSMGYATATGGDGTCGSAAILADRCARASNESRPDCTASIRCAPYGTRVQRACR